MKKILVSGAGGNLGVAVVRTLLGAGYQVVAANRETMHAGLVDDSAHLTFLSLDVLDVHACEEASIKHADTDVVVLLVGGFSPGDIHTTSVTDIDQMLNLNFKSAYNLFRPFYQVMTANKKPGHFIFIGSKPGTDGRFSVNSLAYGLSKSLLFRLAEIIHAGYPKTGIKASIIVPGTMDTPQNRASMPDADFSKWVKTEEVAEAIAFCIKAEKLRETELHVYGGS